MTHHRGDVFMGYDKTPKANDFTFSCDALGVSIIQLKLPWENTSKNINWLNLLVDQFQKELLNFDVSTKFKKKQFFGIFA